MAKEISRGNDERGQGRSDRLLGSPMASHGLGATEIASLLHASFITVYVGVNIQRIQGKKMFSSMYYLELESTEQLTLSPTTAAGFPVLPPFWNKTFSGPTVFFEESTLKRI